MDAVSEVKARLSIEDVVGEYVQLKRAGRNFKGLSPFSNEKTPSFMVSPEKQIWHDFSSGRGGDMFSFIMEVEGMDFKTALAHLARKAGVEVEEHKHASSSTSSKQKERLKAILDAATNFYQVQLTKNDAALRYVREKRHYTKQTIVTWRLGYAPNAFDGLTTYLLKKDFTLAELKKAGVSTERRGGVGDMFRERIIIPLCDSGGDVIGFTARLLKDDPNAPKYINTPQTPIYDKGRHVFGLHLAKEQMRKKGFVVVTEGNLDVISSHQAGVTACVATAGTAMTEMHLKELKRFTGDIRMCFDGDSAGLNATERVIPIASKLEISLGVIPLEAAKDPDELIQSSAAEWTRVIEKPQPAFDWLAEKYEQELDLQSGQGKRAFTDVMLRNIRLLQDPVEQNHHMKQVADKIGVHVDALQEKYSEGQRPTRLKKTVTKESDESQHAHQRAVDHLLSICLHHVRMREYLQDIKLEMISSNDAQTLYTFLREHPDYAGSPTEIKDLHNIVDYVKIATLIHDELYTGLAAYELRQEAARLQSRVIEDYVKAKKQEIAESLQTASDSESRKLIIKDRKLNSLLKKHVRKG